MSVAHANDPDITLDVTGHEYDIDRSFYIIHLAQVKSILAMNSVLSSLLIAESKWNP